MGKRLLVVGAHSADFVWRAGGTVALATSQGGNATLVAGPDLAARNRSTREARRYKLCLIAYLLSQDNSRHANFRFAPPAWTQNLRSSLRSTKHALADVAVLCYTFSERNAVYANLGGSFRGVRTEPFE
jgi:hypothetical protein